MGAAQLLFDDYEKKKKIKSAEVKLSTGKVFKVFFSPVMNVDQQKAIFKHINFSTGEIDTEAFLTSLLVRALNEDGTRMFSDVDRQELRTKVDHAILQELAVKMGGLVESVDPKA